MGCTASTQLQMVEDLAVPVGSDAVLKCPSVEMKVISRSARSGDSRTTSLPELPGLRPNALSCDDSLSLMAPGVPGEAPAQQASFHESVQLLGILGRGSFARVYAGRHQKQRVAVKVCEVGDDEAAKSKVPTPSGNQYVSMRVLAREVEISLLVSTLPNCISTYAHFLEDGISYIAMEFADTTTLGYFDSLPGIDAATIRGYFKQVFMAIQSVHRVSVVHRDIKPDNFLVSRAKCGSDNFTLKLCDFGLSTIHTGGVALKGCYGTAPFMSPEMVSTQYHDALTDIWSAGAVMFTFFAGRFPYRPKVASTAAMKEVIRTGEQPIVFSLDSRGRPLPPTANTVVPLLRNLLTRDYRRRPTADQVLTHSWFQPILDPSDYTRFFAKGKLVGLFDARNMSMEDRPTLSPMEQKMVSGQMQHFARTAKHCMRPNKKVLALCPDQEPEGPYLSGSTTLSGGASDRAFPSCCTTQASTAQSVPLSPQWRAKAPAAALPPVRR